MGLDDKISNKAEDLQGKAKEATGNVTGDDELKSEGKADQASSAVKDGVEKVKDAGSKIKDALSGN
ncbi:CsbD family protein [Gordonia sp. CPCC 205515]|uniref:CsbD family protein n=1 Tax=Gordonia sp. CPCC 205515 TaxID=3140791 RepID=UPI003AF39E95